MLLPGAGRILLLGAGLILLLGAGLGHTSPPYLTGIIEDADAQTVEMPRLPGNEWQRTIAWMAPEGTNVETGDAIVRLDPGTLVAQEESARTGVEKGQVQTRRELAEMALAILDAETAVASAESAIRLARINASAPVDTIARLDYEQYQLNLETTEKALERAQTELFAKKAENASRLEYINQRNAQAQSEWQRLRDGLQMTEIRATKAGLLIYAEGRFTGRKVFPGETLQPSASIVQVASRKSLQFRFWVHEADIRRLPIGTEIMVTPDAYPDASVPAIVDWASKQATSRDDWSLGGYFEITAVPKDTMPQNFLPGLAVMSELNQ
jgi:HlyD family secretion protein